MMKSTLTGKKKFALFDYIDEKGNNDFKKWTAALQKVERAKLNVKLDMLEQHGSELFPELLTGTPTSGILKLRVKANNVQLRPMLCKGPINHETEFTLLIGATEKGDRLIPKDVDEEADQRKKIIIKNPNRRKDHERVS
jgi:hypothetical protein